MVTTTTSPESEGSFTNFGNPGFSFAAARSDRAATGFEATHLNPSKRSRNDSQIRAPSSPQQTFTNHQRKRTAVIRVVFQGDDGGNSMSSMTYLTDHFTREEIELSPYAVRHGLKNRIPDDQLKTWTLGCQALLEPVRALLGNHPIIILSGYRSEEVNTGVGGSTNSQHRGFFTFRNGLTPHSACAFDIVCPAYSQTELFKRIARGAREGTLLVDQCIDEFRSWVHVSFTPDIPVRRQILVARKREGKTIYAHV